MSSFSFIVWKDPNGNGGGLWLFIVLLIALPFLYMGLAIGSLSDIICAHPLLFATLYLILSIVIGVSFYNQPGMKHCGLGVIASILTILPFGMLSGLYAIPFIQLEGGSFDSIFDWILIAAIVLGITYFIFSICNLLGNGRVHFVLALIFFSISCLFGWGAIQNFSWETICAIYGL